MLMTLSLSERAAVCILLEKSQRKRMVYFFYCCPQNLRGGEGFKGSKSSLKGSLDIHRYFDQTNRPETNMNQIRETM